MKLKYIFFILFAGLYFTASSQLKFDWITQAGGPGWDIVTDMKELPNGELAVVGTFYKSIDFGKHTLESEGSRDIFIAQYRPDGSLNSVVSFGGTDYDYAKSIEVNGEKGIMLPVKFYSKLAIDNQVFESAYTNNFLLSWFDNSLKLTQSFLLSSTKEFELTSFKPAENSSSLFSGWFTDSLIVENKTYEAGKSKDCFVGKISGNGELEWFKHFKADGDDVITNLLTVQGVNYISGTTETGCFAEDFTPKQNSAETSSFFMAAFNQAGEVNKVVYPLSGKEIEPVNLVTGDNSLWGLVNIKTETYINGTHKVTPTGKTDVLLVKHNLKHNTTNYCQIGGPGNDMANGLIKSGEQFLVTGLFAEKLNFGASTVEAKENGTDIFIATIDGSCKPRNIFTLSGESSEFPCSAFATETGVYVTGEFRDKITTGTEELVSAGKEDIFLARVENCGAKNPLCIKTELIDDTGLQNTWELDAGPGFVEYSWNNNTANTRRMVTSESGKFTVTVKDFWGCTYAKEIELNTKKNSTDTDRITEKEFKLYPTITSGLVHWEPATEWTGNKATVCMLDTSGKTIWRSEIDKISSHFYSVDFSGQAEGTYLLEISGNDFRQVSKIIVKR